MDRDYVVFLHLLDEKGQIVAQRDIAPAGGTRPTSGWIAGEVVVDLHTFPPSEKSQPGDYASPSVSMIRRPSPPGDADGRRWAVADDRFVIGECG